jgi:hypothetical protein
MIYIDIVKIQIMLQTRLYATAICHALFFEHETKDVKNVFLCQGKFS